jgi:hypothetical protein
VAFEASVAGRAASVAALAQHLAANQTNSLEGILLLCRRRNAPSSTERGASTPRSTGTRSCNQPPDLLGILL